MLLKRATNNYNMGMFWADAIAADIIQSGKYKPYWVDDMKTPSGRVHVGALMGVVIHDLIYRSLKNKGVEVEYTYVFENHDPMDDIPSYLHKEKFKKYLGMPLFSIPSPVEGYDNFATYYAQDFRKTFNAIGCNPTILWTKDLYTSGKMNDGIKKVLDNAQEIRNIYSELYKKEIAKDWYPFQVYCQQCGKVSTTEVTNWDGKEVTYRCSVDKVKWTKGCGQEGKTSPFSDEKAIRGKMPWKVEWPVKWQAIGVTIEGAGKDHMSKGGSHDLASLVAKRVLDYPVPYSIAYEWILIGGRKMSSSKGVGIAASDMLEILPAELIRFLIVKMNIHKQTNFDPAEPETIPKLFDGYQKAAQSFFEKKNDDLATIFEYSQIDPKNPKQPPSISFLTLAQYLQSPNKQDKIQASGAQEWVPFVTNWIEKYAPEEIKFSVKEKMPVEIRLSDQQKNYLHKVAEKLDREIGAEEFQKWLYNLSKELGIPSQKAFQAIYLSLLGKNHGPKAAWLILEYKNLAKKRFESV